MTGIYVPGIEKPYGCLDCDFRDSETGWCSAKYTFVDAADYADCPVSQIENHGRLGDLDALEKAISRLLSKTNDYDMAFAINWCLGYIKKAPTIISGDPEDHDE